MPYLGSAVFFASTQIKACQGLPGCPDANGIGPCRMHAVTINPPDQKTMQIADAEPRRVTTGVAGLDEILHGGLLDTCSYLVRGGPGAGKTTLGMHFLTAAGRERGVFVTLGETESQLRRNAQLSGLAMDGLPVLDLSPNLGNAGAEETFNLLQTWEVEAGAIHDAILDYARAHRPERVFIDALSELRHMSPDAFQFRKQVLSLLRQLTALGATVIFAAERGSASDDDLQFLSDGVVLLEQAPSGRMCAVTKLRGSDFESGWHYYELGSDGMAVYPRLTPGRYQRTFELESIGSGVPELDALTGGGIDRGTVTLLSGPTGVGKTTLGAHYMKEAAGRGERSVIYNFDEHRETFVQRSTQVGLPVREMLDSGHLMFEEVEPLAYDPDRFALMVRQEVERRGTRVVMIDSLSGYKQSMRGEGLQARVHALCRYLVNMGVTVLLINEVNTIASPELQVSRYGISYLADTILLLRYMELDGELRKTVGMLKKRTGDFEKTLRELAITDHGVQLGQPLRGLRGVLSGIPEILEESGARHIDQAR